jgi:hypothetical protein
MVWKPVHSRKLLDKRDTVNTRPLTAGERSDVG